MRDLLLAVIVAGLVPMILRQPAVGVLAWNWFSFMNPHRLTYGFAYSFDWIEIVVAVTLISILFNKEKKSFPLSGLVIVWVLFVVWINVSTLFAVDPSGAMREWDRFMKIQLMVFLTLLIMGTPERIRWVVWIISLSIGFYGFKGGVFSLLTGGEFLVWGPEQSFVAGNNEIALAIVVIMPLLWFLRGYSQHKWVKSALLLGLGLCLVAVISTYSRGALLALVAMLFFLALKSKRTILVGALFLALAFTVVVFMPDKWQERMETIASYQEDGSAMGRINAWRFAANLAIDRPLTGGGFGAFRPEMFRQYAPEPDRFHDAHSIYFEVLGEQGIVGFLLYMTLAIGVLVMTRRIQERASRLAETRWAADLAAMIQVSFIGYGVGGAFLGLAYFDLPYQLFALTVLLWKVVERAEVCAINQGGNVSVRYGDRVAEDRGNKRELPSDV